MKAIVSVVGVVLKQEDGWTYGALVNHIWTYAGDDDRPDVNATVRRLYPADGNDLHGEHRIDLRMGERGVGRAGQRNGQSAF